MKLVRFFYDDGAAAGGGGASPAATTTPDTPIISQSLFTPEELKAFGYDSPEVAKQAITEMLHKKKEDAIPEEQKRQEAEIENANFLKYAAENNLVNDDFKKYDSLRSQTDRDLVYNKFVAEFKEDNPDIESEEFDAQAKQAFENEYRLTSENEKAKTRGEARLQKEAKELRNPAETAYNSAKEGYTDFKSVTQKGKEYIQVFDSILKEGVPDKQVINVKEKKSDTEDGDEIPIDIEISKEDREKVKTKFFTQKTFKAYLDADKEGKLPEFKQSLSKKINSFILSELKGEEVYTKIATTFSRSAIKKGSNIGAEQPFSVVKGGEGKVEVVDQKSKMAEIRESHNKVAQANNF